VTVPVVNGAIDRRTTDVPLPQPKEQSGAAIKAKVKIRILEVLIENCPFCRQDMLRICWDGHSLHASDPQAQVLQRGLKTAFSEGVKSQPLCGREVRLARLHI